MTKSYYYCTHRGVQHRVDMPTPWSSYTKASSRSYRMDPGHWKADRMLIIVLLITGCFLSVSCTLNNVTDPPGYVRVDIPMKNLTKNRGETVRLKCEITGDPRPEYRWFRNGSPVSDDDAPRMQARDTHWGSKLKISDLQVGDSAFYACEGYNRYGVERTTGYLKVQAGSGPTRDRQRLEDGDGAGDTGGGRDRDRVRGRDRDRDRDRDRQKDDHVEEELLPFPNPLNPYNDHDLPEIHHEVIPHPDDLQPNGGMADQGNDEKEGFCQLYRGAACSKFLSNKSIYVRNKLQQSRTEERLTAAFTIVATSTELSQRCGEYAIQSLCFYSFPLCDVKATPPKARHMCRDECDVLENDLCKAEYLIARSSPTMFGNRQLVLPDCLKLPESNTPEADNCVSIGVPMPNVFNPNHRCYNGTGAGYRGTVSITQSGYKCQRWTHTPLSILQYPELGNHDYCRNPGNQEEGPWCFTTDEKVTKELCAVPKCSLWEHKDENMSRILLILVPSIAVPIALALLLTIVCMCRRSKQYNGQHKPIGRTAQQLEMAAMANKVPVRAREFPMANIRFLQELGEGTFGKVYMGELVGYHGEGIMSQVAIKTLKDNAPAKVQNDFRREVDLMTDLKHPNIVCLVGVCMKEQPLCMLFEYMSHGDLHEYLTSHSPHGEASVSDDEGNGQILDQTDLTYLAQQVSAGMEYLASHHVVHRDLAARNILVWDNLLVKVSNLGVSRDRYAMDYCNMQGNSVIPIRWMPPEAILYNKFGTESDVWSFGVVLWEIYNYGLQPYYGYSNSEVIEMIRARQILPCPEECPHRMYSLMMECWNEVPTHRPSFKVIHERMKMWNAELMPNPIHSYNYQYNPMMFGVQAVGNHGIHSSGSVHNSHHSHHSSSGPSGNTTTTGLTVGSQVSNPGMNHLSHLSHLPAQRPQAMPVPSPLPPPPMPPLPHHRGGVAVPTSCNPGLYKKPSPPGSFSSHKSSTSPSSSVSNYKPLLSHPTPTQQPPTSNNHHHIHHHHNHNNSSTGGLPSPTTSMNNYNKLVNSIPCSTPTYIPHTRTSNI